MLIRSCAADPRAGSIDFEPNCFPQLNSTELIFRGCSPGVRQHEFSVASLVVPCRRPQTGRRAAHEHCKYAAPNLANHCAGQAILELPNLQECWAWAHAQAAANKTSDPNAVSDGAGW